MFVDDLWTTKKKRDVEISVTEIFEWNHHQTNAILYILKGGQD